MGVIDLQATLGFDVSGSDHPHKFFLILARSVLSLNVTRYIFPWGLTYPGGTFENNLPSHCELTHPKSQSHKIKSETMTPLANGGNGVAEDFLPSKSIRTVSSATQAIHADDYLNRDSDVAPALHVSTTFRYAAKPEDLVPAKDLDVGPALFPCTTTYNSLHVPMLSITLTNTPHTTSSPPSTRTSTPATPPPTPPGWKPS